jgi:hypothetical protein
MNSSYQVSARFIVLSAAIISVFFLNSCLDLSTDIRFRKDGSVDASLTYVLSPETADFGRGFGSDEPWSLPLTEKDFQQQSLRVQEVDVRKYNSKILSDGTEEIEVVLRAESLEALSSYLDLDMELVGNADSGTLIFNIPVSKNYAEGDSEFRDILETVAGESVFKFSFQPPSSPVNASHGVIEGNTAILEISLLDILHRRAPESWAVSW